MQVAGLLWPYFLEVLFDFFALPADAVEDGFFLEAALGADLRGELATISSSSSSSTSASSTILPSRPSLRFLAAALAFREKP